MQPPSTANCEEWPALAPAAAAGKSKPLPQPLPPQPQPPKPRGLAALVAAEEAEAAAKAAAAAEEEEDAATAAASPLKPSLLLPHLIPSTSTEGQPPPLLAPVPVAPGPVMNNNKGLGGRRSLLSTLVELDEEEEEELEDVVRPASPLLRVGHGGAAGEPALLSFDTLLDLGGPVVRGGESPNEEERFDGYPMTMWKQQVAEDPGACVRACVRACMRLLWCHMCAVVPPSF